MSIAYREFLPSPRFRAHIECFWCHESNAAIADYRVLPDGCVDILFQTYGNASGKLSVIGTMTRAHWFDLPARQRSLGVRFRPAMAARFLRAGAAELVDERIPLSDLWSSMRVRRLAELIAGAKTPEEGSAQIETALGEAPPLDPAEKAIARLEGSHGLESLDQLADAARLSPRQFRRICLVRTGLAPKRLARVLRFRNTIAHANSNRQGDWADVALECGYYDQAHLIHEFQEFSGGTPGTALSNRASPLASRSR